MATHANWASGPTRQLPNLPTVVSQFERMTEQVGLRAAPHLWPYDQTLKAWVKANKNKRYVPEELLAAWDMHVVMDD